MKLLLCLKCSSIFSLSNKEKFCECKACSGYYKDKTNAVYKGDFAVPLVMGTLSLEEALVDQERNNRNSNFDSWIVSPKSPSYKKIG